jgi:hypothetical protein
MSSNISNQKFVNKYSRPKKIALYAVLLTFLVAGLTVCEKTIFNQDVVIPAQASTTDTPSINPEDPTRPVLNMTQISTMPSTVSSQPKDIANWEDLPIIPESISNVTISIFRTGQILHNDPYSFSVVGDCDSSPSWFLGDFDKGLENYSLGEFDYLTGIIATFQGSFARESLAVGRGFNSASVLSPLWADPIQCTSGESPLECEVRIHKPSFAFILLGTNDIYNLDTIEKNFRTILDTLIAQGIVPILATKADNLEGGNQINIIISNLAQEYDIPLWNFWKAIIQLPGAGLQQDGAHLTWARNYFDDPISMNSAWPWRNLTALQVLDVVWRSVQEPGS